MPSKYPGALLEIQLIVLERTVEEFNDGFHTIGCNRYIDEYFEKICAKDYVYGDFINSTYNSFNNDRNLDGGSLLLVDAVMAYKILENQYLEENIKIPVIEKSTFERVDKSFPKSGEIHIMGEKIYKKIDDENQIYNSYMISNIRDSFDGPISNNTLDILLAFHFFTYELLSEQSLVDYRKRIISN